MNRAHREHSLLSILLVVAGPAAFFGGVSFWRLELHAADTNDIKGTLKSGGRTRTYLVHVPPAYDGKKPLPLVFVLH